MTKKTGAKKETRSDFLRKCLSKNPDLDLRQINRRWTKTGHSGEISSALFYQIRSQLGIRTQWVWVKEPEPRARAAGSRRAAGAKSAKSAPARAVDELYQFKITLLDSSPPVWRRIQMKDCTLDKLHEHIQTAMGW